MPDIVVATPADAERLADLSRKTFAEAYIGVSYYTKELVEGYTGPAFSPDALRRELETPKLQIFLALIDGAAVAYAKIIDGKSDPALGGTKALYLERLYVDARFKRQGLGARLLRRVFDEARARAYRHVWLSVWEHNPSAQAFYRAHGFREVGEMDWVLESCGQRTVDRDLVYLADC